MNDSAHVSLPAAPLRPFISHYAGMHARNLPPMTHAGLPSRHVHLIISLARPIEILRMPDPAQPPATLTAFVAGLQDAPASVRQAGDADGLHLFLKPCGVRAILGVANSELRSRVVPLSDIWGKAADHLRESLLAASTWQQRFLLLDRAFLSRFNPIRPPGDLHWAWNRLAQANGGVPIHQLARELALSRRHFGERFHAEFGVAPKTAARIFRFESACRMMLQERPNLAQAAFACGFHDQAHMTREWNSLAGCAPGVWIAQELPNLQDYELAGGKAQAFESSFSVAARS